MDGIILCDKPAGRSSHDEVLRVRRALDGAKTGHAGTLDPFATGLLPILVGKATRIARFLHLQPKCYETVAQLGATSSTGDPTGEITITRNVPPDPPHLPTGELRQTPPAYSAVRVDGVRAYERARRGEVVEVPQRTVTVHRFEQLWRDDAGNPDAGPRAAFAIECSTGTYIRSLVADLHDGYCLELRRTTIGPFRVAQADGETLIGLRDALAAILPAIVLQGDDARRASHGVPVAGDATGPVLLEDADGAICIAEHQADGLLKPVVGFRW
jgi:tRNA pseudouridine55 synthase